MSNPNIDFAGVIKDVHNISDHSLEVTIVGGSVTASNPSVGINGATAPTSSAEIGAIDSNGNLIPLQTDLSGNLKVLTENSLVPFEFDELVISYVGSTTDIDIVIYKLASTTIATLTMTYDNSSRLIDVVRT